QAAVNLARPLVLVFFFQAEDGIRDFHVTGVQTCALPIYGIASILMRSRAATTINSIPPNTSSRSIEATHHATASAESVAAITTRSEERRVGKECRSRWSP